MSEPFLAQIMIVGFNFAPRGWAFCDGQILPINQNQSLYSLLGTTYGGDGRTTFALPELRGRVPIHAGSSGGATYLLGQKGGAETVTLNAAEMPTHRHPTRARDADATDSDPASTRMLGRASAPMYGDSGAEEMANAAIANTGGGQAHENRQPYQVLGFCIALQGLFPSRN